jgi:hypothetical protein
MVASLQKFIKYCKYWLTAANGKGHGIHSPFVFKFVIDVLNDKRFFYAFDTIESIVNADLNNKKFNRLLFRITDYYQPKSILVIDETIGITTSYIALANTSASVYSYFSQANNFQKANAVVTKCKADNCHFVTSITEKKQYDLVYVDALNYNQLNEVLQQVLPLLYPQSILIINNISSSKEIEAQWLQLQTHSAVTLTINLFQIGLVFFRPENKIAQHFTIRF